MALTRRECLTAVARAGLGAAVTALPARAAWPAAHTKLTIERRVIEVNRRAAQVFGIRGPSGLPGMILAPGERFRVRLRNRAIRETLIHWHGQTPPNAQDGVPGVTQPPLPMGGEYLYDFAPRPGTHWMHSHYGLQEQRLMAAPLIVRAPADARADVQEVVLFLHDFTFRDPDEILAGLRAGGHHHGGAPQQAGAGHDHSSHDHSSHAHQAGAAPMPGGGMAGGGMAGGGMAGGGMAGGGMAGGGMAMDLNDVEFDAFLANDRTLDDPEVVRVAPGGRVRLRIINAASSTNFVIDTGAAAATLVAVDGGPVAPLPARRVPLAIAQRADLLVQLPPGQGAWPVLALREGGAARTGIILATWDARVAKIAPRGAAPLGPLEAAFETRLRAVAPPPAGPADRVLRLQLTGGMEKYDWGIDGKPWGAHAPIRPRRGERVRITFENRTMMSHPMHLHGHHFQVIGLNGRGFAGALRDTVLVPAGGGRVTVQFTADNPGRWVMHCHNLYHMVGGMMTEVTYD